MNPFGNNPFGSNNPFKQGGFSTEYFENMKKMVDHYNNVLNEDFWNTVNGMGKKNEESFSRIPIELWENENQLFVIAFVPTISETRHVKASFDGPDQMTIGAKLSLAQPPNATNQVYTELGHKKMTRKIQLPCEVTQENYQIYVENGMAIFSLYKEDNQLEISFEY